jgi:uncharacterized protein YbjT (DUF2867 family)
MKVALVVGATGAVGKALVYQLIEDKAYVKVIVITRRPITIKHPKLVVVLVDFENLSAHAAFMQADDVFCCLGTTIAIAGSKEQFYKVDHDFVLSLANVTLQQGAKQFIHVTAMGANSSSAIFYNQVKGVTENDVAALPYPTIIVVRPSLLLAKRVEFRLGEWIAQRLMRVTKWVFSGALKKYRAIEVEQVANAMRYYAAQDFKGVHAFNNDSLLAVKY